MKKRKKRMFALPKRLLLCIVFPGSGHGLDLDLGRVRDLGHGLDLDLGRVRDLGHGPGHDLGLGHGCSRHYCSCSHRNI